MHEGMRWGRAMLAALLMVMGTLGMSSAAAAQAGTAERPAAGVPIPLWPGGAPLAQGTRR